MPYSARFSFGPLTPIIPQELEKLISYSGTPTAIWRRTGEICVVGLEFTMLTGWSKEELVGSRKFIYEVRVIRLRLSAWREKLTRPGFAFSCSRISPRSNIGRILPPMRLRTAHSPSTRTASSSSRVETQSRARSASLSGEICSTFRI